MPRANHAARGRLYQLLRWLIGSPARQWRSLADHIHHFGRGQGFKEAVFCVERRERGADAARSGRSKPRPRGRGL